MSAQETAWREGEPKWFHIEEPGKNYMLLLDNDVQRAVILRRDGYIAWTPDGLASRFLEQRFPKSPDEYGPEMDERMTRAETIGWTEWRDIWSHKDDCVELRIPEWPEGWTPEPPPPLDQNIENPQESS